MLDVYSKYAIGFDVPPEITSYGFETWPLAAHYRETRFDPPIKFGSVNPNFDSKHETTSKKRAKAQKSPDDRKSRFLEGRKVFLPRHCHQQKIVRWSLVVLESYKTWRSNMQKFLPRSLPVVYKRECNSNCPIFQATSNSLWTSISGEGLFTHVTCKLRGSVLAVFKVHSILTQNVKVFVVISKFCSRNLYA